MCIMSSAFRSRAFGSVAICRTVATAGRSSSTPRRRYVSVIEAAEYLGVSDRTIRQMVSDGRLTAYRNGRKLVRLDLNEIDARMEAFGGDVR